MLLHQLLKKLRDKEQNIIIADVSSTKKISSRLKEIKKIVGEFAERYSEMVSQEFDLNEGLLKKYHIDIKFIGEYHQQIKQLLKGKKLLKEIQNKVSDFNRLFTDLMKKLDLKQRLASQI